MKGIKITKRAHEEMRKLFSSSRSKINNIHTDPELSEIVDNFAFDKTLEKTDGIVLEKTRVMCLLATMIGCNAINEFKQFVDACLNMGVKPREIREIVYMAYPYVGAAQLVDYNLLMNDIFENNGIRLPLDPQNTVANDEEALEKGKQLLDETFGKGSVDSLIASAPKGQEHLTNFMAEYCFGRFYTRTGIDPQHRELIAFCLLAAMGGCDDRLYVHAQGCKNHNISKEEMIAVCTIILPWIGFPRTLNAVSVINKAYYAQIM